MRIRLSDPARLDDLRNFFRSVHAVAVVDENVVDAHLLGGEPAINARHLDGYLTTWLKLHGRCVSAEIEHD